MKSYNTKRVIIYCIGVVLMALGFIFNAKSDLGISPICSVAYCAGVIVGWTFSDCVMILFAICFFAGIWVRGTKVHWTDFLQLPYCFFFTRIMSAFSAILPTPDALWVRIIFLILAMLCIAIGATITVHMFIIPNPGDFMVKVISIRLKKPMGITKNVVDAGIIAIAVIMALIAGRNILECGVGIGTLCTMFGTGRIIALTNHFFLKKMEEIYDGSHIKWLDGKVKHAAG